MPRRLVASIAALASLLAASPGTEVRAATPPVRTAVRTAVPADRLHFGLANGPGSIDWMTSSGVPWRYRYTYLAGGLYGTPWTTWQDPAAPPGQYALDYMRASAAISAIPVLPYYMLLQSHRAADEATDDYNNLNNPALMRDYYANFTLLMQKGAEFGGLAIVDVEPDLWGYLQQRSGNTTAAAVSASVSSSSNPDVSAYPNNVTGFAQALQHLRDVYAPRVELAFHASLWSSMRDIGTDPDPALDPAAEAGKTAAFFNSASPAGWDLVFNDVDDHDAAWLERNGRSHWWDPTNATLPNFARYLAWVSELHARTGRPQVVWQVPLGNQYFLTMNNTPGHYQDNVAEYFMGHTSDLFAAGIVAVLFGAGNADQTTNEDATHDGVTNNNGVPTTDPAAAAWCNACNTHTSTVADDDGGYIRMAVGSYYAPPAPPGAPAAAAALAGQGAAAVWWTPPAGGPAVASYVVSASTGASQTVGAAARSAVFSGLGDGAPVTFSVRAVNSVGAGAATSSPPVTPSATGYSGWFTWYDRASPGMLADNVHIVNPGGARLDGVVVLPGGWPVPFSVDGGAQTFVNLPAGTIGGPLVVLTGGRILAAQRVQYQQSFNEVDAQPASRADADQWFTWFDRASPGMAGDNVHIVNPTAAEITGTVTAGAAALPFRVPAGGGTYVSFPGVIGGPVHVHADSGRVLASQRVQYYQTFNEVAGRPASDASAQVYFHWFDRASPGMLNDNVHLVNPGASPVSGRVVLGPIAAPTASKAFSVGAHEGTHLSFDGLIGGPVTVLTDGGGTVLASQRVQYYDSFNEVAGQREGSRSLAMPWYDLASLGMVGDNVHLLNPGTSAAHVTVTLAGRQEIRDVAPGAETWVSFPGAIGGPLLISSSENILASQRVQYYRTFNEAAAG